MNINYDESSRVIMHALTLLRIIRMFTGSAMANGLHKTAEIHCGTECILTSQRFTIVDRFLRTEQTKRKSSRNTPEN